MPAVQKRYLYAVAFFIGLVIMGAEISAGRLVAPYFGTSSPVWALIIGAVLSSLAIGQLLGGRLSKIGSPLEAVTFLLLVSALLIALLPHAGRLVLGGGVEMVRAGSMIPIVAAGIAITLILALPMLALGAAGPLLIHMAVENREETGAVAGRIYALGSIGSLVGTYGSGLILVPLIGVSRTLWLASLILAAAAAAGALIVRSKIAGVFSASVFFASILLIIGTFDSPPPLGPGQTLIHYEESRLNHVRVVEEKNSVRLYLNDGYAVQSEYPSDGSIPLYDVWIWYAASPVFTVKGRPESVLLIGLGGGTGARMLKEIFPEVEITGVELDPAVVEAGRRFMGLGDDINVVIDDARSFVSFDKGLYDVIIVDAFDFPYVPFQLVTKEFFSAADTLLNPGGALMLNIGRYGNHYDVVDAVSRTLYEIFPHVRGADVDNDSNTILVATHHEPAMDAGADALGIEHALTARFRQLQGILSWRKTEGIILTDDHAPVEILTDKIVFSSLTGR